VRSPEFAVVQVRDEHVDKAESLGTEYTHDLQEPAPPPRTRGGMHEWGRREGEAMIHRLGFAFAAIALIVATLGAAPLAEAVEQLVLPRNSVGPAQLRDDAVTSSKVRNGSLLAADFRAGQLPAGQPGPPGPSDAYVRFVRGPLQVPLRAEATLARLSIPQAGSYLLTAKANVSGHGTVTCRLEAGSDFDLSVATPAASSSQTIASVLTSTFASAGNADLKCAGAGDAGASFITIAAVRVGTLTSG
jgi:hypothetical protein